MQQLGALSTYSNPSQSYSNDTKQTPDNLGGAGLQSAAIPAQGKLNDDGGKKKITPDKIKSWNDFVDFLDKNGYKGSKDLDNRDTKLGQMLLDKYNKMNPNSTLKYEDIPIIQNEFTNGVRPFVINQFKTGQAATIPGIDYGKNYENVLKNLSPIDGWLGSLTSMRKFPSDYIDYINGTLNKHSDWAARDVKSQNKSVVDGTAPSGKILYNGQWVTPNITTNKKNN